MAFPPAVPRFLKDRGWDDDQIKSIESNYDALPSPLRYLVNSGLIALVYSGRLTRENPPLKEQFLSEALIAMTQDLALWKFFHGLDKHLKGYVLVVSDVLNSKEGEGLDIGELGKKILDGFKTQDIARHSEPFLENLRLLNSKGYQPLLDGLYRSIGKDDNQSRAVIGRLQKLDHTTFSNWKDDVTHVHVLNEASPGKIAPLLNGNDGWQAKANYFVQSHRRAIHNALHFASALNMVNEFIGLDQPFGKPKLTRNLLVKDAWEFRLYVGRHTSEGACNGVITAANDLLFSWVEILSSGKG